MKRLTQILKQDKLNTKQQADFLATLAKLVGNGFSLEVALSSLIIIYPQQQAIFARAIAQLNLGRDLANALLTTGLSKNIISQIAIADVHGNLVRCLQENAATLVNVQKNTKKIMNLLSYPLFLLGSLGTLLLFLKVELANQLPQAYFGGTIKSIILILVVLISALFCKEWLQLRQKNALQVALHKTKLPLIGKIYRDYYHYVILTAVATFLKSGLSLQEILISSKNLTTGSLQQQLAQHVEQQIMQGFSLNKIIQTQALLPDEINIALQLGHPAEQLAIELQTIADIKHESTQYRLHKLINKIQPLFFVLIAGIILGTYLSILLPIYSLMKGM